MSEFQTACKAIPSRFGPIHLLWRREGPQVKVVEIRLPSRSTTQADKDLSSGAHEDIDELCELIGRYLDGEAVELPPDHLDANNCSPFQWRVLMAERTIPRGRVCSYGQLAAIIGNPRAARAVGSALARNPFPIVIPCHRTVRSDGSLGGFGGGLAMKRALLEMEGVAFDHRGRVQLEFFWPGKR